MPTPSHGLAISGYVPAFADGALIYGANIQSGVITSAHIADGTVVAADVAAGSITSAKIGTGAVTSVKLGAASVISAKIGTGAVLAGAIGAGAVTSSKIGTNNVHAGNISAKSITSAKIRAAFLSGTLVSGRITLPVAHGLGVKPKFVIVAALPTLAQAVLSATTVENMIYLAAASAATSTNFYVIGTQAANAALKYVAYVQL